MGGHVVAGAMLSRARPAAGRERGGVLPLVALSLTGILAFAALAVDVGNVTSARRHDQATVDAAALAAAQKLTEQPTIVAATAIDFAGRNAAGDAFTIGEFNSCDGTDQPPRFTAVSGASCVAIDDSSSQVRVVLPLRESGLAFGPVVGIDDFSHTAEATAALSALGYGNVLPIGLPNGASGTVCMKVGAGNVPDPECNDNATGNFGFIDFAFFGNLLVGTAEDCSGSGKNGRLANNIAAGIDHDISVWGTGVHGSTTVFDNQGSSCLGPYPNATYTVTGNIPTAFGRGLYAGTDFSDGQPARLQRGGADWGSGPVTTSIAGVALDDVALYDYIGDLTGADVPRSCWRSQFVGPDGTIGTSDDLDDIDSIAPGVAQHLQSATVQDRVVKLVERCMLHFQGQDWTDKGSFLDTSVDPPTGEQPTGCEIKSNPNVCEDPVFTANSAIDAESDLWDIQYSPRFGYVPELDLTSSELGGTTAVKFVSIKPVFLQRVYGGNCSGKGCDFVFDPGVGVTYSGSTEKASAMKAFVIPGEMLPGTLGSDSAPYDIGVNRFIHLVG